MLWDAPLVGHVFTAKYLKDFDVKNILMFFRIYFRLNCYIYFFRSNTESQMFYGIEPSTVDEDHSSESSSEDDAESDELVCSGEENQSWENGGSGHELVTDCEEEHCVHNITNSNREVG